MLHTYGGNCFGQVNQKRTYKATVTESTGNGYELSRSRRRDDETEKGERAIFRLAVSMNKQAV